MTLDVSGSLVESLKARRTILFVGAGASRSLGLPSWSELIDQMARDLGFDPRVFQMHGGYLELAEFYEMFAKDLRPLQQAMDKTWHADPSIVDRSRIHQAIVDLGIPTIYTTNYDRWLEIAYERRRFEYEKIVNVGDFANLPDGVPQIVKLHGDFDDHESLVLTETSYFERLSFESPLDLKLRSDSLGKAILFIGYALSDINIRYLFYKLYRMWADSAFAAARPKSYIFLNRPNPVHEAILAGRGIEPIVSTIDDPTEGLATFLETLVRRCRFGGDSRG